MKARYKKSRQEQIKEYIKKAKVKTQEELLKYLQSQGFDVTQATVSRDIAEINLKKNSSGYYVLAQEEELKSMFKRLVLNISSSGNIVAVNTMPGAAQTVARYIDTADLHGTLGSVAGDDTIFILVAENVPCRAIVGKLLALKEED